jgi:hypothetical protein
MLMNCFTSVSADVELETNENVAFGREISTNAPEVEFHAIPTNVNTILSVFVAQRLTSRNRALTVMFTKVKINVLLDVRGVELEFVEFNILVPRRFPG